jgi:hypothetical protein
MSKTQLVRQVVKQGQVIGKQQEQLQALSRVASHVAALSPEVIAFAQMMNSFHVNTTLPDGFEEVLEVINQRLEALNKALKGTVKASEIAALAVSVGHAMLLLVRSSELPALTAQEHEIPTTQGGVA